MTVWSLGSGVLCDQVSPIHDSALRPIGAQSDRKRTASAVLGSVDNHVDLRSLAMWILAWLTGAPVRVVRCAQACRAGGSARWTVVSDGTEPSVELQRGFNAMVNGLRERERVRDLAATPPDANQPPPPSVNDHARRRRSPRRRRLFVETSVGSTPAGGQPTYAQCGQAPQLVFRDRRQRGRPSPRD